MSGNLFGVLGDINGDGFADVGLSVTDGLGVFLGGPSGVTALPTMILAASKAWASGGDFDGDGYDDAAALLDDGRIAFYRGGVNGVGATPTTTISGAFPSDGRAESGVGPQIRMADLDGDGLVDVLGARPSKGSTSQAELWMVPGATALSAPALHAIRTWPLPFSMPPRFVWDVVVGPGHSTDAVVYVADRGIGAGELNAIPFRPGVGFILPRITLRIEDPASGGRTPIAVGDVNGDGLEDILAMMVDDTDGSDQAELFLGTATGISTVIGTYAWSYDSKDPLGQATWFRIMGKPTP